MEIMSGQLDLRLAVNAHSELSRGIPRFADLETIDAEKQATADRVRLVAGRSLSQEDEKYDRRISRLDCPGCGVNFSKTKSCWKVAAARAGISSQSCRLGRARHCGRST